MMEEEADHAETTMRVAAVDAGVGAAVGAGVKRAGPEVANMNAV
jgi:hypothetical protein